MQEGERKMKRAVIIGAGDISVSSIPLKEEDLVIAADGGYVYCKMLGIVPDIILGDLDSVEEEDAREIAEIYKQDPERVVLLPSEKDDTDTLAAIRVGLSEGCKQFLIYGGQGGRLEHTIANIQCLKFLKEQGAVGYLMDGTGMVLVAQNETVRFKKEMEGYLSLFAMDAKAEGVTIRNMKYELDNAVITNSFPVGVSNEFIGEEGEITVKEGTVCIIIAWVQ